MRTDPDMARESTLLAAQHTMNEQFVNRELEPFLANYHPDATYINFDGTIRTTAETIRAYYTRLFANRRWQATFAVTKVSVSDGCAVVVEDATLTIRRLGYHLHYCGGLTWVHEGGRWRVLLDHLTTISETGGAAARRMRFASSGSAAPELGGSSDVTPLDTRNHWGTTEIEQLTGGDSNAQG